MKMMTTGMFMLLFSACGDVSADEGDEVEEIETVTVLSDEEFVETITAIAEEASKSTGEKAADLKNDMVALELFLKDQEDHEKFCSKLTWKQPEMIEYKKKLRSLLPEDCLPEEEKKLREKLQRQEETVETTEE
jgi:hypothetical protein